jgi:hypothetical protein
MQYIKIGDPGTHLLKNSVSTWKTDIYDVDCFYTLDTLGFPHRVKKVIKWMLKDMGTEVWTGLFYWLAINLNNSLW